MNTAGSLRVQRPKDTDVGASEMPCEPTLGQIPRGSLLSASPSRRPGRGPLDCRDEAVEIVRRRLGDDADASDLGCAGGLGADRDGGKVELKRRERMSGRGGREHDEV